MKRESKYIFRRVISGVLIALILGFIKGCDVKAEQLTPSTIYSYNGTSNSSYTGNNLNTKTINTLTYKGPIIPANRTFDSIRFRYQNITFASDSNLRQLSFVGESGIGIPAVYIQNGTRIYGCYVNPVIFNDTDASNVENVYVGSSFNVICPNVVLNGTDISIWYKYDSYGDSTSITDILISTQMSITLMSNNNAVVNAITDQQEQAHQDSQNTQNAINDVNESITDDNVDNQGSFFSGFDSGSTGSLMDLISLPIDFIDSLNNTCQPIQLPHLQMYSFDFQLTIPCMSAFVYNKFSTTIINTLKLIINGFLVYGMLKWFIGFIHDLKDPNNDDLEVMDL